ncbi:MAG: hypothetical protein AB9891_22260 [Anaerolineaceae bacterium]
MTQKILNEVSQLVFSGLKEIVGIKELARMMAADLPGGSEGDLSENETAANLLKCHSLDQVQVAMEKKFDKKELQGLLVRVGRASCKFFVKQYGPGMQVTSTEYRLLPSKKRLAKGLNAAAGLCSELFKKEISVVDEGDHWIWQETDSPSPSCAHLAGQDCFFMIGLLQEYLAWLSGGKAFSVNQTGKAGLADNACCLTISKQPIE